MSKAKRIDGVKWFNTKILTSLDVESEVPQPIFFIISIKQRHYSNKVSIYNVLQSIIPRHSETKRDT